MKVTVKDIARELGVSVGSVSTALNDKPGISLKMKEMIRKKANEMGYVPNQAARNLVQKKTNKIAFFILSRNFDEIKSRNNILFNYMLEEARKSNKNLLVYSGDFESHEKGDYIRICREENVLGAIFMGIRLDDPSIEVLQKVEDFPVVVFDTSIGGFANAVITNNAVGVTSALNYLYNIGHRDIGIINGHEQAQVTRERYEAAEKFLKEKGIFNPDLIYPGDFTQKSGYEAGKKILESSIMPSAVFSFSDLMAFGAMKFFNEKEIRYPDEISIVGFDDMPVSDFLNVTTVGHDYEKISLEIMDIILNRKKSIVSYVDPKLVIRNTCKKISS